MISIYLNSLYNLLYYNNPIMVFFAQTYRNLKMLWHHRRTMERAQQRLHTLENRFRTVEAYVNAPQLHYRSRFNVTR